MMEFKVSMHSVGNVHLKNLVETSKQVLYLLFFICSLACYFH